MRKHPLNRLDEDIRDHIEREVRDNIERGMSPSEARRAALCAFGNVALVQEDTRAVWTSRWADNLRQDIRYAVRTLRRSRGFAAVAMLTLALGIGANTAIFSAVYAVVLRPLPYHEPDRLVLVWEEASSIGFPTNTPAPANYFDWKRQNAVFTDMAATASAVANLTVDGPPEQVLGRSVTANFFTVLGVRVALGRALTVDEERTRTPVVLISHRLWQRRYSGAPDIVGRSIRLNGTTHTVVGVLPRDFVFRNREIDFWIPARFTTPEQAATRDAHFLNVVARLRDGVSIEQARANMNLIARELAIQYPATNTRTGAVVVPLAEDVFGNTRLALLVLMGAASSVLLIACANLASLLMSRALARHGELAIRAALGATRGRLIEQSVVEALLLMVGGGALGLTLAPIGMLVMADLVPPSLPVLGQSVTSVPLLMFTVVVSLATALLFSVAPAVQSARRSVHDGLQAAGRAGVGGRNRLTRDILVVAEVATALVLLVGAGLMLRTVANLRAIDLGFRSERLLTMQITISRQKYAEPSTRQDFYDRVLTGVRAIRGVQGAGFASTIPFQSVGNTTGYQIDGQPAEQGRDALFRVVTGDYLQTLGVELVEGRLLDARDTANAPKVVVINETLAQRHWPDESALGHRLVYGFRGPHPQVHTIIGVVRDVRERGYLLEMKPGVYYPFAQEPEDGWNLPSNLLVRTADASPTPVTAIRRIVSEIDPEQPVTAVRTMDEIIDLNVADRRQPFTLLSAFAALALLLAACGLYGVLSYAVTQRRQEIGLRIALGASGPAVVRLVVAHGLTLTAAGIAIGLGLTAALTRTMRTLLYGVSPTDVATLAGVLLVFGVTAGAACGLPALRATRVDPMHVLRQQ
jgi:putative ABC transport system permease protein